MRLQIGADSSVLGGIMAVITRFERSEKNTVGTHPTDVVCYYTLGRTLDDRRILQLDTRGSRNRQKSDGVSQTFQLNEEQARQLWEILVAEFGFN